TNGPGSLTTLARGHFVLPGSVARGSAVVDADVHARDADANPRPRGRGRLLAWRGHAPQEGQCEQEHGKGKQKSHRSTLLEWWNSQSCARPAPGQLAKGDSLLLLAICRCTTVGRAPFLLARAIF